MPSRAKTIDLYKHEGLSGSQQGNSRLNMQEILAKKTSLKSYPRRIVLELTNDCELNCIMCGRRYADFKKTYFNTAWLDKLTDALKYAEEVSFIGWGEATMHPQFSEILGFIESFPVKKYLLTNGCKTDLIQRTVFDKAIDLLAVSLDGSLAATNNSIRRGSDFNKIITMLREITAEKKKGRVQRPYINLVMTLMRSNLHEFTGMIELAGNIGVEEVKAVYLTAFANGLLSQSLFQHQDEVRKVFQEAITLADSLGVKLVLPHIQGEDPADMMYHKECYMGWRDFFLGSDGYVRPCMSTCYKLLDFNNISNFEDMWNCKEFIDFRRNVNNPDLMIKECKRCYQSSHANWNRKEAFLQLDQPFSPEWGKIEGGGGRD